MSSDQPYHLWELQSELYHTDISPTFSSWAVFMKERPWASNRTYGYPLVYFSWQTPESFKDLTDYDESSAEDVDMYADSIEMKQDILTLCFLGDNSISLCFLGDSSISYYRFIIEVQKEDEQEVVKFIKDYLPMGLALDLSRNSERGKKSSNVSSDEEEDSRS